MKPDDHRLAAEQIEASIALLQSAPNNGRLIIEGAWGAGFHWIAFGCQTKYGRHQESHSRLGTYLRLLSEVTAADWWDELETRRQGGWYGRVYGPNEAQEAIGLLNQLHNWATA